MLQILVVALATLPAVVFAYLLTSAGYQTSFFHDTKRISGFAMLWGASLLVAGSIPQQTQTLSMAIYDAVQAGHDELALLLVVVTSVLSVTVLVLSNRFFSLR